MQKILWLFILSSLLSSAQSIQFKESKFIEGLDLSTHRKGTVTYTKEKTVIQYQDGKMITKLDNILTVHNEERELLTSVNLDEKPHIALYFTLTKSLFSKDFNSLKEDFSITENNLEILLIAHKNIQKIISDIKVSLHKDETINFFIINFTNKDTIKIEAL